MTEETNEVVEEIKKIKSLSHVEMARLWREAPACHIYFNGDLPYFKIFSKRFQELGGMTTAISKLIGW